MDNNAPADLSATAKPIFAQRPELLELDPQRYMGELSGLDISDAQKVELLSVLWAVMRSFVELGVRSDVSAHLLRGAGLLPAPTTDEEGSNEDA